MPSLLAQADAKSEQVYFVLQRRVTLHMSRHRVVALKGKGTTTVTDVKTGAPHVEVAEWRKFQKPIRQAQIGVRSRSTTPTSTTTPRPPAATPSGCGSRSLWNFRRPSSGAG